MIDRRLTIQEIFVHRIADTVSNVSVFTQDMKSTGNYPVSILPNNPSVTKVSIPELEHSSDNWLAWGIVLASIGFVIYIAINHNSAPKPEKDKETASSQSPVR